MRPFAIYHTPFTKREIEAERGYINLAVAPLTSGEAAF